MVIIYESTVEDESIVLFTFLHHFTIISFKIFALLALLGVIFIIYCSNLQINRGLSFFCLLFIVGIS